MEHKCNIYLICGIYRYINWNIYGIYMDICGIYILYIEYIYRIFFGKYMRYISLFHELKKISTQTEASALTSLETSKKKNTNHSKTAKGQKT